jgi:phosphatidylserine/phosphatidylglycerophosphate/cardiolipin synthase-like enzyme
MIDQTQALKSYLKRRQETIGNEEQKRDKNADLFNEKTFYSAFVADLLSAKKEVIIYSPFVTKSRTDFLKPTIQKIRNRNIEIFIFTRPISEYESFHQPIIVKIFKEYEAMGVCVIPLDGSIHQKVAVVDREILWDGSLNIMSQKISKEMMRRTVDESAACQVMSYIGLNRRLAEEYKIKYEKLYRSLITRSSRGYSFKLVLSLIGIICVLLIILLVLVRSSASSYLPLKEIGFIFKLLFNNR